MSVRVLLADDQAMVRTGFRMILESDPEIDVVGEAANGEQAVAATRRLRPDVVLMDIQMPGEDGLQATRRIVNSPGPTSRVVILTTFERDEYVFEALQSGASGFLLKNAPPEELVRAVRVVAGGASNAELAGELFVSEGTIKTHVSSLLAKLGLRDRVQAVVSRTRADWSLPAGRRASVF